MTAAAEVYGAPLHGWTCFHCGETFHTPGAARDHFGPTPASAPGCIIKAGEERGLLMALRKAEATADDAVKQRELAEQDARAAHAEAVEVLQLVPGAANAHDVRCHLDSLEGRALAAEQERDQLRALIDSPYNLQFLEGVRREIAHQVQRWGTAHDRAKAPADWLWLLGYLSGKALAAHIAGDTDKAMHHCISSAAVLANWHTHILLGGGARSPGSSDLQRFLQETFGEVMA